MSVQELYEWSMRHGDVGEEVEAALDAATEDLRLRGEAEDAEAQADEDDIRDIQRHRN